MSVCKSFTEENEIGDIIHCYHIICFSEYFSIYLLVLYIYNTMNVNIFGGVERIYLKMCNFAKPGIIRFAIYC